MHNIFQIIYHINISKYIGSTGCILENAPNWAICYKISQNTIPQTSSHKNAQRYTKTEARCYGVLQYLNII